MTVTKNIAQYIKDMGINLSELSRKSGVPYGSLYASLGDEKRSRELRANELTDICFVLHINPMDFTDISQKKSSKSFASPNQDEGGGELRRAMAEKIMIFLMVVGAPIFLVGMIGTLMGIPNAFSKGTKWAWVMMIGLVLTQISYAMSIAIY